MLPLNSKYTLDDSIKNKNEHYKYCGIKMIPPSTKEKKGRKKKLFYSFLDYKYIFDISIESIYK